MAIFVAISLGALQLVSSALPPTLTWQTNCADPSYHFCGVLEFCQTTTTPIGFAYRLPGAPCTPAKSPVIRMSVAKKYHLTLRNTATEKANLHTHGLHISGDGNSDDITRTIDPGLCMNYTWNIPDYHLGGLFWYHGHVHELTRRHVAGGAFGAMVVEDTAAFLGLGADFQKWLLNEQILIGSRVGSTYLGNGNVKEEIPLVTNEWTRVRVVGVNPNPEQNQRIRFLNAKDVCSFHATAHDGVPTWKIPESMTSSHEFYQTGATRLELAVRCKVSGSYQVEMFGGVVATLVVKSDKRPSTASPFKVSTTGELGQWSTANLRPNYLKDFRNERVSSENKFSMTMTAKGIKVGSSSTPILFDMNVPLKTVQYDTLQEWTIYAGNGHPFHLHVYHMQIVSCGKHSPGEFYDVISSDSECTVRFRTIDLGGRVIFHCHLLEHEDAGTMGWVNVIGPTMPAIDRAYLDQFTCPAIQRTAEDAASNETTPAGQKLQWPLLVVIVVGVVSAVALLVGVVVYRRHVHVTMMHKELEEVEWATPNENAPPNSDCASPELGGTPKDTSRPILPTPIAV